MMFCQFTNKIPCLHKLSIFLVIHLGVELLGCVIILSICTLWRACQAVFQSGCTMSHPHAVTDTCLSFRARLMMQTLTLLFWFAFPSKAFLCAYRPFVYHLWRNVCLFVFFLLFVEDLFYIFWIVEPYKIWFTYILSPILWAVITLSRWLRSLTMSGRVL
jgi:hypothetical protein